MNLVKLITKILAKPVKRSGDTIRYIRNEGVMEVVNPKGFPARRGYRADLGIEFKSSMEANLYRFYTQCCKGIMSVKYEPELFKFPKGASKIGITGYIPDFKLSNGKSTWYVEAKGHADKFTFEKTRLFRTYYPHKRLIFVNWEQYLKIKYHYSKKIKGWE